MFTDTKVNAWLSDISLSAYASLHYQSPALGGAGLGEISGGGYTRMQINFTTPASRSIWNSNALAWTGLTETTIVSVGIFDDQFSGNLLAYIIIPSFVVVDGSGFNIAANDLSITFP